jgi:serine/threonine-protein kinase
MLMLSITLASRVLSLLGWLVLAAITVLTDPASAQGGASCLFQCDSQCYGQSGPYCRSGCMARCNSSQDQPGSNPRPSGSFAAIAATATTGDFFGYSYGWSSREQAEQAALANCNRQAGAANACIIAIWFGDGCGALAIGSDGAWGGDWGPTSAEASAKALLLCQKEDKSGKCEVVKSFCAN